MLREHFKRSDYQKVILPFITLKRLDDVLSYSKDDIIETYSQYKDNNGKLDDVLMEIAKDKEGNNLGFYNYSKFNFNELLIDPEHIEENLFNYLDGFSDNILDLFENFHIRDQIFLLSKSNVLYLLINNLSKLNLNPDNVPNQEMGIIFEELVRKFAEQSNENAGEYFTPRDVAKLIAKIIYTNESHFKERDIIKVYDPACGSGGMLTSIKDHIKELNDSVEVVLFGQEINEEAYATCKSYILLRGENSETIKGPHSTLSQDKFPNNKFDLIISHIPFGRSWYPDQDYIKKESDNGFKGRFGAGLPRINDGQLLFLQHMISKMNNDKKSKIALVTNELPLFIGDAGSGESDIRKWVIENNFLEAVIALPEQLFYNTGIKTYIWVLTNEKSEERMGKIQLIDATSQSEKKVKKLWDKTNFLANADIEEIVNIYTNFEKGDTSRIFDNNEFGYTKFIVERPLQLNYEVNEDRLENLHDIKAFINLTKSKNQDLYKRSIEEDFGKEKQEHIKNALRKIKGNYKKWEDFEVEVAKVLEEFKLSQVFIKKIILALSEHDDKAEYVIDSKGIIKSDLNLRNIERIDLKENVDEYFEKNVKPYHYNAWINDEKNKIGYEINFMQQFYKYEPPKLLKEINFPLKRLYEIGTLGHSEEIDDMLLISKFPTTDTIFKPELDFIPGKNEKKALNQYLQLKVNNKNEILPQYLKIFLNSRLGKYQRTLFSHGFMGQTNVDGLKSIYLPIPDLKTQKDIINADQEIIQKYNEMILLYDSFKNKIFNFKDILELISGPQNEEKLYNDFLGPLAVSYIIATKGTSDSVLKAISYFDLFEFVAAFNSIFLLSSLPEKDYEKYKESIWEDYQKYRSISFGSWVGLYRRLSKIFQKGEIITPFDKKIYDEISSPKMINIIDTVPAKRNRCYHGGNFNAVVAENIISELNPSIDYIFKILTSFNTLDLIYTETMEKEDEIYKIKIKRLKGPGPFTQDSICTKKDMDSKSLYLYNPETDERLKLKKEFIKLVQCPECGHWSLFIYNKIKKNKAIYSCYQTEQHDYIVPNISLEELIGLNS